MTTDILLRPVRIDDIDSEYCGWYQNEDGHLNYFTGSRRRFSQENIIEDYHQGIQTKRWFYYLIESRSGQKIGNVKIGQIDLRNKTSDLVCLIGNRSYAGKGIGSQAISLANQIAFNIYDIRRLHGGMYASNISSIKAYKKAGWIIEAVFKGYYLLDGDIAEDRVCVACFNPKYFHPIKSDEDE